MGIATVLGLVSTAMPGRLLTPAEFGVVAIAFVLQRFGQFIADLGVGQALIQKPELSGEDVQAGFTSSIGLGLLATVAAWMLAPLAGQYFGMPDLVMVFRGYAVAYLLNAMIIISQSLLRRQLKFRPLMIGELVSLVIGHGMFGLGAAYLGFGAFSLAISQIAQALIQMVILYCLHPPQPAPDLPARVLPAPVRLCHPCHPSLIFWNSSALTWTASCWPGCIPPRNWACTAVVSRPSAPRP